MNKYITSTNVPPALSDLKEFIESNFNVNEHFTIIYGSYAYGEHTSESDLDFMCVVDKYTPEQLNSLVDFTIKLHDKYKLKVDEEVPHENKIIATYSDVNDALLGLGFSAANGRIIIPDILKTPSYLSSRDVKLRLILNSLTGKNVLLSGDEERYLALTSLAKENLLKIYHLTKGELEIDSNNIVDGLISDGTRSGEMYLGYKDKVSVRKHLNLDLQKTLNHLTRRGIYKKKANLYILNNEEWLSLKSDRYTKMDFSVNKNPLGPPEVVFRDLAETVSNILTKYPEDKNKGVIKEISNQIGIKEQNICLGIGATEIISSITRLKKYEQIIIFDPTFWEYEHFTKAQNKIIKRIKLKEKNDFRVSSRDIEKSLSNKPAIMFICNPNNPTSTLFDKAMIIELSKKYPKLLIVIDETYLLFREDYHEQTLRDVAANSKNIVVIFSLSKFYSLPSLRVGVCISSEKMINKISESLIPYGVSTLAQTLLKNILNQSAYEKKSREYVAKEIKTMHKGLENNKLLKLFPINCNLILLKLPGENTKLLKLLKSRNISVRDGQEFDSLGNRYIRLCVQRSKDNGYLIGLINDFYRH